MSSIVGIYIPPENLLTDRFALRRTRISDAKEIFHSYASDPVVTRYLGWKPHNSISETSKFLNIMEREWIQSTGFPFVISSREKPSDLLGMIHAHVSNSGIVYGYVLARKYWGKGCASEALKKLVDHALAHPKVFRTSAFCDLENLASARVLEKSGMMKEGVLRRYFHCPNISDQPRDCIMFARVK